MAADLAASPSSSIEVLSCGDAHLSNFGIYAAPDRELIFDLNDFDEAAAAPAEWDVKRLITSAIIGGRHAAYREKTIERLAAQAVSGLPGRSADHAGNERAGPLLPAIRTGTVPPPRLRVARRGDRPYRAPGPEAYFRTGFRTHHVRGTRWDTSAAGGSPGAAARRHRPGDDSRRITAQEYLTSVPADVAVLLSHFRVSDVAMRVVGVGSVGTRCFPGYLDRTRRHSVDPPGQGRPLGRCWSGTAAWHSRRRCSRR